MAALLGILVLRYFEKHSVEKLSDKEFVRVYAYGTPSCVDAKLADHPQTLGLVTSGKQYYHLVLPITNICCPTILFFLTQFFPVVLHDDVVPRLTPTSVRGLLKHLLYIRETWVKTHLSDDLNAITERASHVWPARLRGSFTLMKKKGVESAKRLKKSCKKRIQTTNSSFASSSKDSGDASYGNLDANVATEAGDASDGDSNISSDEGVIVEGDLFFDPLDDPLNESDDESSIGDGRHHSLTDSDNDWVPFDEPPVYGNNNDSSHSTKLQKIEENQQSSVEDGTSSPQMLEELPLPRMFIPGRIVHIYTHRGGYKAGTSGKKLIIPTPFLLVNPTSHVCLLHS